MILVVAINYNIEYTIHNKTKGAASMRYKVELDGISLITSKEELVKGDLIRLHDSFETNYYKVGNINNDKVEVRLLKYTENVIQETKFDYYLLGNRKFNFEKRLSKNQIVMLNGLPCQIKDIDKETKNLKVDILKTKTTGAVYGAYEHQEGSTTRDREQNEHTAEKYFRDWGEAYGYVLKQRGLGRKISL